MQLDRTEFQLVSCGFICCIDVVHFVAFINVAQFLLRGLYIHSDMSYACVNSLLCEGIMYVSF